MAVGPSGTRQEAQTESFPTATALMLREPYRKDIDGLRALAVLSVVLFHAGVPGIKGGFVGVDVFFVISGYLIGDHIYRDVHAGQFSLARFYMRRAKRILPALFVVLAFCYVVALVLLSATELRVFGSFAVSTVFSFSNLLAYSKSGYFAADATRNPLLMTWSLGVEEQFYIFFPLLMLLFARLWGNGTAKFRSLVFRAIGILALLSFALSIFVTAYNSSAAFYMLPTRAWEIAAGVLLAVHEARPGKIAGRSFRDTRWANLRSLLAMIGLAAAVVFYGNATPFPGMAAAVPAIAAVLLLSSPHAWLNRVVLSCAPFRWVGLISYSFYLWHWPLLCFARLSGGGPLPARSVAFLILLALGFSFLSYRFVEQPFRSSKLPAGRLLRRYACVGLLFALPGAIIRVAHGFPNRYPALSSQENAIDNIQHSCLVDLRVSALVPDKECLPPDDGRPALALLGDSHADALAPQLRQLAAADGLRFEFEGHAACPPLLGVTTLSEDRARQQSCLDFNRLAISRVADDPSVRTVLLVANWAGPAEWEPAGHGYVSGGRATVTRQQSDAELALGLASTIRRLQGTGKRVLIMLDIPAFRFDPLLRARAYFIPAREWLADHLQALHDARGFAADDELYIRKNAAAAAVVSRVASRFGVTVIDPERQFCTLNGCRFYSDGTILFHDTNHLTAPGATLAVRSLTPLQLASMPNR